MSRCIVTPNPTPAANGTPAVMTAASISAEAPAAIVEGSSDDLATIIYTSGTTGTSKGVMLSHGNLLANAEDSLAALALNETDMTLSHLPIAHSFERTAGYYTVAMAGGTIAFAESLGQIASNLTEVEPTVVLTVPRLLEVIHSRVMRTVETSPPMRQRLFKMALERGRASGRISQSREAGSADARAVDGAVPAAGLRASARDLRQQNPLPDFRRRAAADRDQPVPVGRRSSNRRRLRLDRGGAGGRVQSAQRQDANRHGRAAAGTRAD